VILRCTQRLLDLLGSTPLGLTESKPCDDDWYANLLWVDRQKCLLLTHAGTLFSVFVPAVRKADLRPIGPYVVGVIEKELHSEELPMDILGPLDPDQVVIAKTASRRTLGYMKEIALHARYQIEDEAGSTTPTSAPSTIGSVAACTTTAAHTPTPSSASLEDNSR